MKVKKKLDPNWAVFFIDILVGSQLMILSAREPNVCEKLGSILVRMLVDEYGTSDVYQKHPEKFINKAKGLIFEYTALFFDTKAKKYLKEGMPKKAEAPRIITTKASPSIIQ